MKRVYRLPGEDQKRCNETSNRDDGRSHGDAMPGIFDSSVPELHKAARKGDKAKVERLLQKPDTVYRDSKQRTALHYASAYGHPEVVRLLIQKKFDLNALDSDHDTALIKAVKCYEEDCVSILLEHGANPNITNAKGNTALHYAVYSSKSSLAAKLLSHGADAEAKNKEGLTPLRLALMANRMETATLLKKTGTKNVVNEPERKNSQCEKKESSNSDNSPAVVSSESETSLTPGKYPSTQVYLLLQEVCFLYQVLVHSKIKRISKNFWFIMCLSHMGCFPQGPEASTTLECLL
ncbi:putative ankyrin repeat domain-containing protein 19 [Cavia porcellus]|uniref:putative ankyrin repeat domain-containing protein 19 n=1 Tax=Cavia porcellus TaxID=10141 RepID=UPI002FE1AA3E